MVDFIKDLYAKNLDHICQQILLLLGPTDMKHSCQVSCIWNEVVKTTVWGSQCGHYALCSKLRNLWLASQPKKIPFHSKINVSLIDLILNKKQLACVHKDGTVVVYNMEDQSEHFRIKLNPLPIVKFSSYFLISLDGCGSITIWDRNTGEKRFQEDLDPYRLVSSHLAVTDNIALVLFKTTGQGYVLNIDQFTIEPVTVGHSVKSMDFDGRYLIECALTDVFYEDSFDEEDIQQLGLWKMENTGFTYVKNIAAQYVDNCVLTYPYAITSDGGVGDIGIGIWDLEGSQLLQNIECGYSVKLLVENGLLITSWKEYSFGAEKSHYTQVNCYNLNELHTSTASQEISSREILRVHLPNGTIEQNLLTTQKNNLVLNEANTLYVLDFWN